MSLPPRSPAGDRWSRGLLLLALLNASMASTLYITILPATLIVDDHEQGALGGLTTAAQTLGFVIGPVAGGALYQLGQLLPGLVAAAAVLAAAAWAWTCRGEPHRSPDRTDDATGQRAHPPALDEEHR